MHTKEDDGICDTNRVEIYFKTGGWETDEESRAAQREQEADIFTSSTEKVVMVSADVFHKNDLKWARIVPHYQHEAHF